MELVDLNNFFSLTALVHLSRLLAVFNIVHILLKDKISSLISFLTIVGIGMVWCGLSLELLTGWNENLLYGIFFSVEAVIVFFVCKGRIFEKLLAVALGFAANLAAGVVATQIMMTVGFSYSYFFSTNVPDFFVITFSIIIYSFSFLLAFVIKFIKTKFAKSGFAKTSKSYVFLLLPLLNIIFFLSYSSISQAVGEEFINSPAYTKPRVLICIFAAICFVSDILLFFYIDYIDKMEIKNIESEKQILANTMSYHQTIMLNEEKKELRKIKHDINNLLTTATGFIELGKPEKALEILNETGNSVLLAAQSSICTNDIINTVIYIKQHDAASKGVNLSFTVCENAGIRIADFDLCRLLHNLIDNSVNASERSDADKNSHVTIKIENEEISVSTVNAFDSNSKSKSRDKNHGYGKTIINEICKKYNGNYSTDTAGNKYIVNTTIKNITLQ